MKLGTLIYQDKSSSKQILQGCKQQQIASGKNTVYGVSAYNLVMVGPLTMKLGELMYKKHVNGKTSEMIAIKNPARFKVVWRL